MELAMVGLGKMGFNMARRLMGGGHRIIAYDPDEKAIKAAEKEGAAGARTLNEITQILSSPRIVWVMVPSGEPTEDIIFTLATALSAGDTIIDGGNSNYKDSMRRARMIKAMDLHFIDVGTSGGIHGLTEGYSLMIGGEKKVVQGLRPIFETLAPQPDKGWGHVGPCGAGHFVKMVHNGIEYGMMEAYAEGFDIMKSKGDFRLDMHQIAQIWRHGSVVRSWLLDLAAEAFAEDRELEGMDAGIAGRPQSSLSVAETIEKDVPAPVITLALEMRLASRYRDSYAARVIAAMRSKFGGPSARRSHE